MLKRITIILYIVVIAVMAIATIVEKYYGTEFVHEGIYGAWWFSLLWGVLTAAAIAYFIKRRVRRWTVVLLHLSFVVILAGALLTHLTATQGTLHLRKGEPATFNKWTIVLDSFSISYHEGTMAASNYTSRFTINDESKKAMGLVSMNKIFTYRGVRFYQSGYDPDEQGAYLSYNSDPWGIPVTYTGYALLFFSLLAVWVDRMTRKSRYSSLSSQSSRSSHSSQSSRSSRSSQSRNSRIPVIALLMLSFSFSAQAQRTIPAVSADQFGRLNILYNDRICPVQTFAMDFTKKLYGKASYKGFTAEQVLAGFLFFPDEWSKEPIVKVKSGAMKDRLQLPDYCAVTTFFNHDMGGYILGPYLQEAYQGNRDKFHSDVLKMDDRLMLVMELRQGTPMKVFPFGDRQNNKSGVSWFSPTDKFPAAMEQERQEYMKNVFGMLYGDAQTGNMEHFDAVVSKMAEYQRAFGGASLPSKEQVQAERIYNKVPFATILFMVCLTMAFLSVIRKRWMQIAAIAVLAVSFVALTICLALRWIVSGTIPMANGYETMLLMAWLIQLLALVLSRRYPLIVTFGLLMSGFFLLVSHISQMDPQISHVMPVLSSPLLSLHVSIIMMAFALLSLTFIIAVFFLGKPRRTEPTLGDQLTDLSKLFLYPAIVCLGFGIFIGAIWANVSWGTYWGWDPKEVWALITFMVYSVALHEQSLAWLRKPKSYHLFMFFAFLTILMTYFGVNYFLGGMHSYA